MINKKLKAFTILEVTMAMLLAGITIAVAFTAYSMILRSYKVFDDKNKTLSMYMQLDRLLQQDIEQALSIVKDEQGLHIKNTAGTISYAFNPEFISRDQYGLQADTFKIINEKLSCYLEEQECMAGEQLDKISFTIFTDGKPAEQVFVKHYSAEELIRIKDTKPNAIR